MRSVRGGAQDGVVDNYPSVRQVVLFACFVSRHRERACLAQRVGAEHKLTGKVRSTNKNMISELIKHAWPSRWPAYKSLPTAERLVYKMDIMEQV